MGLQFFFDALNAEGPELVLERKHEETSTKYTGLFWTMSSSTRGAYSCIKIILFELDG